MSYENPESESAAAKLYWRTHHQQTSRIIAEGDGQDHRYDIARHILAHSPRSVLEFGCASGRNLRVIHTVALGQPEVDPPPSLVGIDMNPTTIAAARDAHGKIARFILGDESMLTQIESGAADVVFTCSVLDHIPNPKWKAVYDELKRIARVALVLLEPIRLAPADPEFDYHAAGLAVPFTYSHAYFAHDPKLRIVRPMPLRLDPWPEFAKDYTLMQLVQP